MGTGKPKTFTKDLIRLQNKHHNYLNITIVKQLDEEIENLKSLLVLSQNIFKDPQHNIHTIIFHSNKIQPDDYGRSILIGHMKFLQNSLIMLESCIAQFT